MQEMLFRIIFLQSVCKNIQYKALDYIFEIVSFLFHK